MKGKIAFIVGAAVGYVLGTRAGRERYEQIKRGAEKLWNTEPIQKGVGAVRGVLDAQADEVKAFVRRASSDAFSRLANHTAPEGTAKPGSKPEKQGDSSPRSSTAQRSSTQQSKTKKDSAEEKS